jgi:hemoglobin
MPLQTLPTQSNTQDASAPSRPAPTLYERLGKATGIRSLVDDIVTEHMNNPVVSARFLPYASDPARLAKINEHTCAFLAAGSGGPAAYAGRSMAEAHRGMNVSAAE